MNRMNKRLISIALGLVLAGILAGGVVAAQFGGLEDPDDLAAALDEGTVARVADIGGAPDQPDRGVFVELTSNGLLCLFEAPSAGSRSRQGGCNSAEDPLGGRKLSASLSYDGGPAPSRITDARLIGLVSADVASVQVLMTDGARRTVLLSREAVVSSTAGSFRAFGYRFRASDLRRGAGPTTVVALDSAGREIDRQTTGFAG